MIRHILVLCLIFLCIASAQGQTLRIRSNSVENLHIVAVGIDKDGNTTTRMLYDFTGDHYKRLSLFEEKYGYDYYHNKEMKHEGLDPTCRWTKLMIYDASNTIYDTIDITKADNMVHIGHASIWAKIKIRRERDYILTDVIINDDIDG